MWLTRLQILFDMAIDILIQSTDLVGIVKLLKNDATNAVDIRLDPLPVERFGVPWQLHCCLI